MMNIWDSGVNFILFLQGLGTWLTTPMKFFSFLGTAQFFLVIMPALYWCVDTTLGIRIGLMLLVSASTNRILMQVFHGPRPYWYSLKVKALSTESSFGLPSGHAQVSAGVWGIGVANLRRRWVWIIVIVIIFLIGLSRIYLGVHFPSDVIVGWLCGALLLWAFIKLETPIKAWLSRLTTINQVTIFFLASLVLILLGVLARLSQGSWTVPAIWVQNAAAAAPKAEPINPLDLTDVVTFSGTLFGFSAGVVLINLRGGVKAGGELWKRVVRYLAGLVGMLAIYYGLGLIFPGGESILALALGYLRFGLTGLWIAALAPIIFIATGLSSPVTESK